MPELSEGDDATYVARVRFGVSKSTAVNELQPFKHTFTHFRLTLAVTQLVVTRIDAAANAPGTVWLARNELQTAALPKPISTFLARL